jgi:DivIVA domain-containing protein
MVVLFAVLVVAVIGGAVLVALRFPQAGQLPEAAPDQAVAGGPAEGPWTADDLRRVRFPVVFRGYRMADVDALLDRLAEQQASSARPVDAAPPGFGPQGQGAP